MKFVILYHECETPHYDLMLEKESALETWQIPPGGPEALLKGNTVNAHRIFDHRKKYLTYNGPIRGGDESVLQYDMGTYWEQSSGKNRKILVLSGNTLKGTLTIYFSEDKTTAEMAFFTDIQI